MHNLKKHSWIILLLTVLSIGLAGCGIKTPMSDKALTSEFHSNATSLMKVKQLSITERQNTTKETKKFNGYFDKQIQKEKAKVQKSVTRLNKEVTPSGYPKAVQSFSQKTLEFIYSVTSKKSLKEQNKAYHGAAKAALEVGQAQPDKKNIRGYITTIVQEDSLLQPEKSITKASQNGATKSKKKVNTLKTPSTKQKKAIVFSINSGLWMMLLSGLLITVIFLQPSKSDDSMNALTESGGASLFNTAKPHGYTLFLMRTTEILIGLLVITLIIMNR